MKLKKIKYHYPIIIELIDRWIDNSKFKNNKLKIKYINKLVNDIFIFLKFYKIDLIISQRYLIEYMTMYFI